MPWIVRMAVPDLMPIIGRLEGQARGGFHRFTCGEAWMFLNGNKKTTVFPERNMAAPNAEESP